MDKPQADHKVDYFQSPMPKNQQCFNSLFHRIRGEEERLFEENLFTPFNRDPRSPFSAYSPAPMDLSSLTPRSLFLASLPDRKQIQRKIGLQDSDCPDDNLNTPEKLSSKVECVPTTGRKKYNLRLTSQTEKHHLGKDSERGLRALSKQAFEILQESNEALSYQEVALRIIEQNDEIGEFSDVPQQSIQKFKQSIKRRVYDALNVLIAVGMLEKDSKKISVKDDKSQLELKELRTLVRLKIIDIQFKRQYIGKLQIKLENARAIGRKMMPQVKGEDAAQQRRLTERTRIICPLIVGGQGQVERREQRALDSLTDKSTTNADKQTHDELRSGVESDLNCYKN